MGYKEEELILNKIRIKQKLNKKDKENLQILSKSKFNTIRSFATDLMIRFKIKKKIYRKKLTRRVDALSASYRASVHFS